LHGAKGRRGAAGADLSGSVLGFAVMLSSVRFRRWSGGRTELAPGGWVVIVPLDNARPVLIANRLQGVTAGKPGWNIDLWDDV